MSVVESPNPRRSRAARLARFISLLGVLALIWRAALAPAIASPEAKAPTVDRSFQHFIESVWPQAKALGVSRQTFDLAFKGVAYDPRVVAHTKSQAEFVKPIWEYLAAAVSPRRVVRSQALAQEYEPWLAKAQSQFGVDRSVVIGIW